MSENTNTATKQTWLDKALTVVENVCNKLPDPVILFCWLFLFTAIIGTIATVAGVSLINPASGETVVSQNFFSADGLDWFLNNMVKNFTGFAPLGLVITMTLGIGLCEESGLIMSLLKGCLSDVPPVLIPYLIAFVGTIGNIASDQLFSFPHIAGIRLSAPKTSGHISTRFHLRHSLLWQTPGLCGHAE